MSGCTATSGRRERWSTGRCTCVRGARSRSSPRSWGWGTSPPDGFCQAPLTVTDEVEILSWSTGPFEGGTELIGTGAAHAFAEIDQDDPNFVPRMWDSAPGGSRQLVTTGCLSPPVRRVHHESCGAYGSVERERTGAIDVEQIQKNPPHYTIRSVDHALRIAAMLQLEGELTVSEIAQRLGVARSTAHRLLAMLVYRDFAVKDDQHRYRAGPVVELAAHSPSHAARLRSAGLPHLHRLVDLLGESANLAVRTGDTVRFIAGAESPRALRVGNREGMVFPVHRTTAGMLLLAELPPDEVERVCSADSADHPDERPDPARLRAELTRVRRDRFAVNHGRSERGVVALGVPVRDHDGTFAAGMSVSMPSVRYDRRRLSELVSTLRAVAQDVEDGLAAGR